MFKKPIANIKTFSPLRSSDRRRFQQEARSTYPQLNEEEAVMQDDLRSAKFTTNAGIPGIVYIADNHQPLWISIQDLPPIPTVYTTWKYPNMLPTLYTWSPVVQKLIEGADLMIPGLVPDSTGTLPDLEKGDLVAITIRGYTYPLAIGTMALPTSDIRPRSGMKGKAVHIIHVFQDYLWAMGDKSEPPGIPEDSDDSEEENEEDVDEASPTKEEKKEEERKEKQTRQLNTEEIDDILKTSLYHALVYKVTPENNILPISASSFYSAYVIPSRPIGADTADIKRSSWKKLQKFIKTIEKSGLLKTKEQRGEIMIISIQWSHSALENISKYKTIEHSTTTSAPTAQKEELKPAEIQEFFKPLGALVCRFFDEVNQDKNAFYTWADLRTIINDYVKANGLANPKNQKMVRLDAILCDAVLSKSEYKTIDQLARDQLVTRLTLKMQPFHTFLLSGQKEPVLRKGHPKPVEIIQEIRQGRKTVTKVTGVEAFNLDVENLIKEFTRLCASSVTSNPIHGVSPKNPQYEIMVQGPQIKNITEFLLNKGVPKKLIESTDKTQKKKK